MKSLHYRLTSYSDFLEQLAQYLGVPVRDHMIEIPPHLGSGYFRTLDIDGELEAFFYDASLTDGIIFHREKDEGEYYTLVFDEFEAAPAYTITIADEKMEEGARRQAHYLTSFLYDVGTFVGPGDQVRGLRVLLPVAWIKKYLQLDEKEDVLEKYINLKASGIWYKPIDLESQQSMQEVLSGDGQHLLYYRTRILRIVENFFQWLYSEAQTMDGQKRITRADIKAAEKIEDLLTKDVTVIPPTIPELARQAAMSESKLKKIFKSVYGMPPYEYFQKHRMQKARSLLLSGEYSIKDVGYTLGYSNLSNFTLAFKKEFGMLPSQVLKSVR